MILERVAVREAGNGFNKTSGLMVPSLRDEETATRVDPAGAIRRARRRMIGRPMPWNAVGRPAPAANICVI